MSQLEKVNDVLKVNQLRQLSQMLNSSIDNLFKDIQSSARHILFGDVGNYEKFDTLAKNLKTLENAKTISNYLDSPTKLDECMKRVKDTISRGLLIHLTEIEEMISNHNFYQFEKDITSFDVIFETIGNYCSADIIEKRKQIEVSKERSLRNLEERYEKLNLNEYTIYPPKDSFEKFPEIAYSETQKKLKEIVFSKYRNELKSALDMSIEFSDSVIRNCEFALSHFPKDYKLILSNELESCKSEIASKKNDHERNLDSVIKSKDLLQISAFAKKCKDLNYVRSIKKIEESILNELNELKTNLSQASQDNNIKTVISIIKKSFDYKCFFAGIFGKNLLDKYESIKNSVGEIMNRICLSFQKQFLHLSYSDIEKSEKDSQCFLGIIEFIKENTNKPILTEMIPLTFRKQLDEFDKIVSNYLDKYHKEFSKALDQTDCLKLKSNLDVMKKWNRLFDGLKKFFETIGEFSELNQFICVINKMKSYPDMQEEAIQNLTTLHSSSIVHISLINSQTEESQQNCEKYYQELNTRISKLLKVKELEEHLSTFKAENIKEEITDTLKKELLKLNSKVESLFENFPNNFDWLLSEKKIFDIDIIYINLVSFDKFVKEIKIEEAKNYLNIEEKVLSTMNSLKSSVEKESPKDIVASDLIKLKSISRNMLAFKKKADKIIDIILGSFCSRKLLELAIILNQDKRGIGSSIISDYKAFQFLALELFNLKTGKHNIEYVLKNIQGDNLEKEILQKRYRQFRSEYEGLGNNLHFFKYKEVISNIKLTAGDIRYDPNRIYWDVDVRIKVPKLVAQVCALWTLESPGYSFKAHGLENEDNYLFSPLAAQVIAIFRTLGIGDKKEELQNSLIQVETGQGKSVVLALTACILALLGFDVSCACYSTYLSQRDWFRFQDLFDSLGIANNINYGTLNEVCEDFINKDGDIKKKVENFISGNSGQIAANNRGRYRPKVLLIDEVDVLFSKDFYGGLYTPSTSLRDPNFSSLLDMIWDASRCGPLSFSQVKSSGEYQACCDRFQGWEALLDELVKEMLFGVQNYSSHDYVVKDDKIGYKYKDDIVFDINYGFQTVFAYYFENERNKITNASLERNKFVPIRCGTFPYAEIPLKFNFIMGFTGTLSILRSSEKEIIQNVFTNFKQTFMPSIFGVNNLKFNTKDSISIENNQDYFNAISTEIDRKIIGRNPGTKRAVLVFFESSKKLKEFYHSGALGSRQQEVAILNEELSTSQKEKLVRRATTNGQVTLATSIFGRGTDFVCLDQFVYANGGVHVIQTFLSVSLSEEMQIKARTARQGEEGSYSMVLLDSELEKFQITREDIQKAKQVETIYDLLNKMRNNLTSIQYQDNSQYLAKSKSKHEAAEKFLDALNSNDAEFVKSFLVEQNQGPSITSCSKTLCLLDATGSMGLLLTKVKNTVETIFERASQILKENNINTRCYQIQFAVYRNYNSREDKILEYSTWESNSQNLRQFISRIEPEGGHGNEAIEIGLLHANTENTKRNISQVILIGDAPANTLEEVQSKRNIFGEDYWKESNFRNPKFYKNELKNLKDNSIPVHAFYVDERARLNFEEIANETKGKCQYLDINSPAGSILLTDLVTIEVLRNVGNANNMDGNKLANAYQQKYAPSDSFS